MSNYPPGVTGNEPYFTGRYPCSACGGAPIEREHEPCWCCRGSGVHPEDAPQCPACGSERTVWVDDLTSLTLRVLSDHRGVMLNAKGTPRYPY
jgi:hypothetical protein